jgi:hypothetical protein
MTYLHCASSGRRSRQAIIFLHLLDLKPRIYVLPQPSYLPAPWLSSGCRLNPAVELHYPADTVIKSSCDTMNSLRIHGKLGVARMISAAAKNNVNFFILDSNGTACRSRDLNDYAALFAAY